VSTIELHAVAKSFGPTAVLHNIDLVVPDGSTTAVLGASGSGKTTLLRLIAGFDQVDSGQVTIAGQVLDDGRQFVRAQHRAVGYVPQDGALFPHLTVAGNIGFGVARPERSRVNDLIELVGLNGLARRYPHQLSGGQQQRVALARALATRPRVVLLDEPFSSLDASLRAEVRRDVARVLAETATTTVLVTHDQDEALEMADQIAVLRLGHVVACADPRALYHDPPDVTAATAIGEANILVAQVDEDWASCVLGTVALHGGGCRPTDGGLGRLLLRPEQLILHLDVRDGAVRATVKDSQYHGHDMLVDVVVGQQALLARVAGDLQLTPGQPVWIEVRGAGRMWSDTNGAGTAAPTR